MKLKLSEFASVAKIVGAFVVVVSLIHVGVQVNESNRAVRSASVNDASELVDGLTGTGRTTILTVKNTPGMKRYWLQRRTTLHPRFVRYCRRTVCLGRKGRRLRWKSIARQKPRKPKGSLSIDCPSMDSSSCKQSAEY